ncbi:MAG: HEAT repeat domain-containing protein [Gemmataceae bacterium]
MRPTATLVMCLLLVASPLLRADSKEEQVAGYIKDLKSKEAATRRKAAEEIGKIGQSRASIAKPAVQPLLDALKDKDADVRAAAVMAVSRLDEPKDAVPAIVTMLKAEKESKVKAAAAGGLGLMGEASKEALPVLKEIAEKAKKDDDKRLQRAVGDAMRQINGKKK